MINRYWQPVLVTLLWILSAGFVSPDISHAQKFVARLFVHQCSQRDLLDHSRRRIRQAGRFGNRACVHSKFLDSGASDACG